MNKPKLNPLAQTDAMALGPLLGQLHELIVQARTQALRAVDTIQVQTCWQIGRYIVEFEQQGQSRATYGARFFPQLAECLTQEFGRGFDVTNLRHMRAFYQAFPIRDALRPELSWTHYRRLLRLDSETARQRYVNEAVSQNWSSRALERQINTLYYERLLASQDKAAVTLEANTLLAPLNLTPREFVRDPSGHRPNGHVRAHARRPEKRAGRQPHRRHYFVFAERCLRRALLGFERQRATVCQPLQTGAAL